VLPHQCGINFLKVHMQNLYILVIFLASMVNFSHNACLSSSLQNYFRHFARQPFQSPSFLPSTKSLKESRILAREKNPRDVFRLSISLPKTSLDQDSTDDAGASLGAATHLAGGELPYQAQYFQIGAENNS